MSIVIGDNPLIEELDTGLSALELFEFFRGRPFSFFLDSAMDRENLGRYSIMGSDPFLRYSSRGSDISVFDDINRRFSQNGDPLNIFGDYLDQYRLENTCGQLPCGGGAFGYFSYDLGRTIENLPVKAIDDLNLPECWFGFYDFIVIYDNLTRKAYAVSTGFPDRGSQGKDRAVRKMSEFKSCLNYKDLPVHPDGKEPLSRVFSSCLTGNFSRAEYLRAVARALEYIVAGEIYEVNLSQRFEAILKSPSYDLYLRLREINPAPFAAYMNCGEVIIASTSPERFLRCRNGLIETRPIKGTLRRGATTEEDRANAAALLNSIKDRAENMMIVDLERNDLGKVCRPGSVRVTDFAALEIFPTVFHLTSTIAGELRKDKTRIDLLRATLPGGSVTGAPKIRSMEIIEELEPTRRSIYTGSLGYLGFEGNMDLSIVIRSFIIKGNKAHFQVGGAVVYDSEPELEYNETLDKARALIDALNLA